MSDLLTEKEWGEDQEVEILRRWLKKSSIGRKGKRVVRARNGARHDFLVLDSLELPLCYVEIKVRRTAFEKYGDAIFPLTKHEHAKRVSERANVPLIGVVEYGCGTLVEVALFKAPALVKDVGRRDRPHLSPVPHAFYSKAQLTVLEGARKR